MPRRNPPRRAANPRSGAAAGWAQRESGHDGEWIVRSVPGSAAQKTYRCPGCDHEIRPGVAHVVAWSDDVGGAQDRRHWHTQCWRARGSRGPTAKYW